MGRLRNAPTTILAPTPSKSTPRTRGPNPWTVRLEALLTVPFPYSLWGMGTTRFGRSVRASPTSGRAAKHGRLLERLQGLAQALVLDPKGVRSLARVTVKPWGRRSSTCSSRLRRLPSKGSFVEPSSSLATTSRWVVSTLVVINSRESGADAGERRAFPGSPEMQVRVAEDVNVTGAAQALTRGILASVMNQQDRQIELPLQRAKVCQ